MQCGKSLDVVLLQCSGRNRDGAHGGILFNPASLWAGECIWTGLSMDEIVLHAVVPFTGLYGYKYAGFPGLRALVFFEVMAIDTLMFSKRPWSLRGSRRHAPMGADGWVCSLLYAVHQMLSLGPCTVAVHGAPGHSRWEVVETPVPVKTQGR